MTTVDKDCFPKSQNKKQLSWPASVGVGYPHSHARPFVERLLIHQGVLVGPVDPVLFRMQLHRTLSLQLALSLFIFRPQIGDTLFAVRAILEIARQFLPLSALIAPDIAFHQHHKNSTQSH